MRLEAGEERIRISDGSVVVVACFSQSAYLGESFTVAFSNTAYGSEQMKIYIGPNLFGLAAKAP